MEHKAENYIACKIKLIQQRNAGSSSVSYSEGFGSKIPYTICHRSNKRLICNLLNNAMEEGKAIY